ncbi:multidrug resistance efflux transporter family protein [Fictibacillus nanhaiensis]|uniref:DMT family transporter n=1 Tax=Fictibacillus nanhaiensis TaxID=742169 RepID=UPI001C94496B|nr:multidrug resistance efflux transporter family protein [Fictibacillus nanhaiensis]MBY6037279.1 multidrug resistance efflux transporter family protein [Fictibacillus nanhaiensis]
MKPIILGIGAAFFFGVTFILNRSMDLSGGSWHWSAALRFFYMVPLLWLIVWMRGNVWPVFQELRERFGIWFLWSTVGFVLFYAPITYAAGFGAAWLVAATWQITIVAGSLLVPFFYETNGGERGERQKIPFKGLGFSVLILAGVALVQVQEADAINGSVWLHVVLPVLIAAIAYPLGNRKMMVVTNKRLDAFQRAFGMTIASLPWWVVLAVVGFVEGGPPTNNQLWQTFLVAISSGVIATVLFFQATDLCANDPVKLAGVEATQSAEIIFVLAGEMWLLSIASPTLLSLFGVLIIMLGMFLHSFYGKREVVPKKSMKLAKIMNKNM